MTTDNKSFSFSVPGVPVAQPRQRQNRFAGNYTPAKHPVNQFKALVVMACGQVYNSAPFTGPVRLDVKAVMPRPKNKIWKTKEMPRFPHTAKPDRDNILKAVQDALENVLYRNDSQVYAGSVWKVVASGNEQPHTEIKVQLGESH